MYPQVISLMSDFPKERAGFSDSVGLRLEDFRIALATNYGIPRTIWSHKI